MFLLLLCSNYDLLKEITNKHKGGKETIKNATARKQPLCKSEVCPLRHLSYAFLNGAFSF